MTQLCSSTTCTWQYEVTNLINLTFSTLTPSTGRQEERQAQYHLASQILACQKIFLQKYKILDSRSQLFVEFKG